MGLVSLEDLPDSTPGDAGATLNLGAEPHMYGAHDDIHPDHLLGNPASGHLSGVIDFSDAMARVVHILRSLLASPSRPGGKALNLVNKLSVTPDAALRHHPFERQTLRPRTLALPFLQHRGRTSEFRQRNMVDTVDRAGAVRYEFEHRWPRFHR